MMRTSRLPALSTLFPFLLAVLAGCGKSPPSAQVQSEVEKHLFGSHRHVFDGAGGGAEVTSLKTTTWERTEHAPGMASYAGQWTGKLRFTEPLCLILHVIDGTKVVQVVAQKGDEIAFSGKVHAGEADGKWSMIVTTDGDPWSELLQKTGPVTMGYKVYSGGLSVAGKMRSSMFEPLSKLQPCIVEGSEEEKKFTADAQEKQRLAQERAAERQRVAKEQTAEKQRLLEEENKRKAEEQRRTRMLPMFKPFQSKTGVVITSDAGATMGSAIVDCEVDEAKLTMKGRGVDLREMPFREFTVEGSIDDRNNTLALKTSIAAEPMHFGAAAGGNLAGTGMALAPLSEADRATIDGLVTLGKRLQGAPPLELKVEILDAAAAKAREPQLKVSGIKGTVHYRGRNSPAVAPLFAGSLAANRNYRWVKGETVAVRLAEPAKGTGLYIRGTNAPTDNLIVVLNGVHRVTIAAIDKLGGAVVALPSDLEVLDIRFEAGGTAQSRAIAMIQ